MSYPSVFCVKCKSHTDTLGRHTIQLSNNRRALKGVCPVCATETYRFMPEKGQRETQLSIISSQRRLTAPAPATKRSPLSEVADARGINLLTRLDFMPFGMAERILHYSILVLLFTLSVAIGYVLCSEFLGK